MLLTCLVAIMGHVLVQNGPKSLNRIEVGEVGRQLDQMDTAGCPGEKGPDIGALFIGGVVPDDINDALIGFRSSILVRSCTALTPSTVVGSTKGASKVSRFTAP